MVRDKAYPNINQWYTGFDGNKGWEGNIFRSKAAWKEGITTSRPSD